MTFSVYTYRAVLELPSFFGHLSQPAPAYSSAARSVKQVKAVAITHARHTAKQRLRAKGRLLDKCRARYSTQVVCVELQRAEADQRRDHYRCPLFRRVERAGDLAERLVPFNRPPLVARFTLIVIRWRRSKRPYHLLSRPAGQARQIAGGVVGNCKSAGLRSEHCGLKPVIHLNGRHKQGS